MNAPGGEILTGVQALYTDQSFSHVVVLPYTSRLVIESGSLATQLSWPSEIALHAGTIALNQHDDTKLIVIGEDDHEGLESTTDLTVERATTAYGVDRNSIQPVHRLRNGKLLNSTDRQIVGAAERLANETSPNVLVVAFEPHLKRVMKASLDADLLANFVSVEEVLEAAEVHSYDDMLPAIAGIARSECIKRHIGRKVRALASALVDRGLLSHVYLDVDETTGKLVKMPARRRRKQLERQLAINSTAATTPRN